MSVPKKEKSTLPAAFTKPAPSTSSSLPQYLTTSPNLAVIDKATVSNVTNLGHGFRLPVSPNNPYSSLFDTESEPEVMKRVIESRKPLPSRTMASMTSEEFHYGQMIKIPRRAPPPPKNAKKSKPYPPPPSSSSSSSPAPYVPHTVAPLSKKSGDPDFDHFTIYIKRVFDSFPPPRLNRFETNFHMWKELWKCCEISNLLMLICDGRHPQFHCPPSLIDYVIGECKKPLILVLNKVDLIPPSAIEKWMKFFHMKFPNITTITFTSNATKNPMGAMEEKEEEEMKMSWRAQTHSEAQRLNQMSIKGKEELFNLLREIKNQMKEKEKIQGMETSNTNPSTAATASSSLSNLLYDGDSNPSSSSPSLPSPSPSLPLSSPSPPTRPLVIGVIGHPNAGKSSILNSIFGRPVVSVSSHPGHTKHIQTLLYDKDFTFCDCPGIVFPAIDVPLALQVVAGQMDITKLREPYSAIQFIAERYPLEKIYQLEFVNEDEEVIVGSEGRNNSNQSNLNGNGSTKAAEKGKKGKGKESGGNKKKGTKKKEHNDEEDEENDEMNLMNSVEKAMKITQTQTDASSPSSLPLSSSPSVPPSSSPSPSSSSSSLPPPWSAYTICLSLAHKRNFRVKGGAGNLDGRRAAIEILQDVVEGRIAFYSKPNAMAMGIGKGKEEGEGKEEKEGEKEKEKDTVEEKDGKSTQEGTTEEQKHVDSQPNPPEKSVADEKETESENVSFQAHKNPKANMFLSLNDETE